MNKNLLVKLQSENESCFNAMMQVSSNIPHTNTLPQLVKSTITKVGIDSFIYDTMEKDILNGNFSVIYLDDRLVYNKQREKCQKELNKIRKSATNKQNSGMKLIDILFLQ